MTARQQPKQTRRQRFLLRAINFYQVGRQDRPSPCRFTPSCSEYSREAVEVHGAGRGTWLTGRRLLRCRPFGPSGYDPVPESESLEPVSRTTGPRNTTETMIRYSPDRPMSDQPNNVRDPIGRSH